jgi:ribosome-binding protein aMBF1 (putative translation factor)
MRLSEERALRGWSRAELARQAGLNASTVGLIESGRLRPYPSQVEKLARALNIADSETHLLLEDTQVFDSGRMKHRDRQ